MGSTKIGGASFSFRYTMGNTAAAAAAGPWSSWIDVTSGSGGDYCVTGLDGFRPTLSGVMGSYIQYSSTNQTFLSAVHVPSAMPGQGRSVQANVDPTGQQQINTTVNIVENQVSDANVQFMKLQEVTEPAGAGSQQSGCRLWDTVANTLLSYATSNCFSARGRVGLEQALSPSLRESGDSVVPGATVCLSPQGAPSIIRCDVTDSNGEYEINLLSTDVWRHSGATREDTSLNGNTDRFTMWVVPPAGYRPSVSYPYAQRTNFDLAVNSGGILAPGWGVNTGNRVTQNGSTLGSAWTFALVRSPTLAEQHDPGYSPSSTTPGVEVSVPQTQDTTMPPGTIATIDPATVPSGWIVSVDPNTHVVKATPPGNAAPGATANIGVIFTYTDGSVDTTTATVTVNAAPTPTVTTTVTSTAVTTQVTTAVVTTTTTAAPVTTTETTTATSLVPTTTTAAPVTTTETTTAT
ncbi:MAG TPA: YPDG domain-containing protein, partial [Dietzia sp.]|nr:YPDG domain-containing protein [Dietzia sp.]